MKRTFQSIGYLLFIGISFWILLKAITSYQNPFNLYENPLVCILLVALIMVILTKEYVSYTRRKVVDDLKNEKLGIVPIVKDPWAWYNNLIKKFTKTKAIEEEHTIELDHNYDGIKELDNVLPPWWVYLFYATITFGVIYFIRFQIAGGDSQEIEYKKAVIQAQKEIDKYKKSAPDIFDIESAVLLTDDASLAKGKKIFSTSCVSCHGDDGGGGIGPNLTDQYWVLGGGFKNVFNTIYNGGRDGKGMISWKKIIKPNNIQKIASYIISLEGSKPKKPKKPQGEIWESKEN